MTKTKEDLSELSFQLILHSGNARSCAMEAIALQKQGKSSDAQDKLKEAEHEFVAAHKIQTALIQQEVNGEKFDIPMILIYAQDHLMTSMTTKDLAIEIVKLHKKTQKN
ncbi:PTS lactose/cellobiose transporter subunit IIA [Peribacillus frigoritolerans]|uniref:PTS lactose/cellobiose transporter subunit IIA n=1 Tax=Peribacillus frigoritolerans TaxID=450367 RepID=UPI002B2453D2|nr:PTS lactose/cellobiose transporter subunit IIA [Peribacillus frigoritolerans]MEB2493336.1 PTS lactose/cellobiose transporter subunit IIA [Peribacillus frigoritolerans]